MSNYLKDSNTSDHDKLLTDEVIFQRFIKRFIHVAISDIEHLDAIQYLGFLIYPNDLKNRENFVISACKVVIRELRLFPDSSKKESNELGKQIFKGEWSKLKIDKIESTFSKAGRILDKRIIAFHSLEYAAQTSAPLKDTLVEISKAYKLRDCQPISEDSDNHLKRVFNPSRSVIPITFGLYKSVLKTNPSVNFKQLILKPYWVEKAIIESHRYIKHALESTGSNILRRIGTKVIFKPTELIFVKKSKSPLK
jgi:hypothetical protein